MPPSAIDQAIDVYPDEYPHLKECLTEFETANAVAVNWGDEHREVTLTRERWTDLLAELKASLRNAQIREVASLYQRDVQELDHISQEWLDECVPDPDDAVPLRRLLLRVDWSLIGLQIGPDGKVVEAWIRDEIDGGGIKAHYCNCTRNIKCTNCTEADQEFDDRIERVMKRDKIRGDSPWQSFRQALTAKPDQAIADTQRRINANPWQRVRES